MRQTKHEKQTFKKENANSKSEKLEINWLRQGQVFLDGSDQFNWFYHIRGPLNESTTHLLWGM